MKIKVTELAISTGVLRGGQQAGVQSFKAIPYAAPPVGSARFLGPQCPQPWAGVRDARRFAPAAMQPRSPLAGGLLHSRSEDCLHLNVWAPVAPGPHPVLVWIHGGMQMLDGTANAVYDGAGMAARGVVVVSVGYRIGVFGFLSTVEILGPEYAGSENNALRDVVAALGWVRDEISAFGGDAARVTIAGESAGAKNVCTLLAMPQARPLFSSAIS